MSRRSLICWLCSIILVRAESSPTVHIKNGTLEGIIMKSRNGREFVAFRGIPYAQPPLGILRFEPPKPFDAWTEIRSAKEEANICIQRDVFVHSMEVVGNEDCLYLNVYTPMLALNQIDASQTKYPVMIYLHGGALANGAGNSDYFGPKFLLDHDIVLVGPNYRLGPLGFLSTEDMVLPGNLGLKDQVQALKWVQENIAAFGGDPNRVTIFGESAGATSVHHHIISPLSKDLFHRAISQSGTVLSPWAMSPKPGIAQNQAKWLGTLLGCPIETSSALVECLRKKNAVDIIKTDYDFLVFDWCPLIPFRPVVEPDHPGAFITEEPAQRLKSGNVADVPWMTGFNSQEGAIKVSSIYGLKDKGYVKLLDEQFLHVAPMSLLYEHSCPKKLKNNISKKIREFYFGDKKIDESTRMAVVDMYTDAWISVATDNAIREHLKSLSSPVYYYYFSYRGTSSFSVLFGDNETDYGVSHGDELQYLFPMGEQLFPDTGLSTEDHRIIDVMTGFWVNFAKSGNPTPEISPEIPVKWKPVRTSDLEYLDIGNSTNLKMGRNLLSDRVKFWANIPYRGNIDQDLQRERDEF